MKADSDRTADASLCPSAPAQEGAVLLTVVGSDGETAYMPDRIHVTAEFLATADPASLERRFRFASPCKEMACAHWSRSECSITGKLLQLLPVEESAKLPGCAIRRDCRWYSQAGLDACLRCPLVSRTESKELPTKERNEDG